MYRINKIALMITILIFILITCFCSFVESCFYENKIIKLTKVANTVTLKIAEDAAIENIKGTTNNKTVGKSNEWTLRISAIGLCGTISNGTDSKTLDKYIGHFENTKKSKGNIGLAAHNRGYKVNYFSRIKELEKGDLIYYQYNDFKKAYEVEKEKIILDTDWSLLKNTEENYLTLITCLENVPQKRRCIIAKEKL